MLKKNKKKRANWTTQKKTKSVNRISSAFSWAEAANDVGLSRANSTNSSKNTMYVCMCEKEGEKR